MDAPYPRKADAFRQLTLFFKALRTGLCNNVASYDEEVQHIEAHHPFEFQKPTQPEAGQAGLVRPRAGNLVHKRRSFYSELSTSALRTWAQFVTAGA